MNIFKSFFTAIAATLILCGTTFANDIDSAIGATPPEVLTSQATEPTATAPKGPDYRTTVTSDFGGSVGEYIQKYNLWRQEGRKIRVDDDCMSACTFMLGRLKADNVCVSDIAQFAFHSAYQMSFAGPVFAKEATRLMWQYYPEPVKVKLREAGWASGEVEHPDFIYIKATEFYELCQ